MVRNIGPIQDGGYDIGPFQISVAAGGDNNVTQVALATITLTAFNGTVAHPAAVVQVAVATITLTAFSGTVAHPAAVVQQALATITLTAFNGQVKVSNNATQVALATITLQAFSGTVAHPAAVVQQALATITLTAFNGTVAHPAAVVQVALATITLNAFAGTVVTGNNAVTQVALATITLQAFAGTVSQGLAPVIDLLGEADDVVRLFAEADDVVQLFGEADDVVRLEARDVPVKLGQNFALTRAQALRVRFTVEMTDGRTFDGNESWQMTAWQQPSDGVSVFDKTSGFTVTNPSSSTTSRLVEIKLAPADTSGFADFDGNKTLVYNLAMTKSSDPAPVAKGDIDFSMDLAR